MNLITTSTKKTKIKPISFYNETKFWPFIIVFENMWKYASYNTVVYLAAITGIDGAGVWQCVLSVLDL